MVIKFEQKTFKNVSYFLFYKHPTDIMLYKVKNIKDYEINPYILQINRVEWNKL